MTKKQSPYIFISHSSQDTDYTQYLDAKLTEAGYTTWVDVEGISDGTSWLREIQTAVEGCTALIVVMSANGRASEWVERETLLALQLKKPVYIALFEDVPLPLHLINLQFSDFRKRNETGLKRLLKVLEKSLKDDTPPTIATSKAKISPDPNRHNFFKFITQLPDGDICAKIARDLFTWAHAHTDAVTFSGRISPAFHAHIWIGAGGVTVFSVRAYPKQPAVEIPMQYFREFSTFEDEKVRIAALHQLNDALKLNFTDDRASKRPNIPLAAVLADEQHLIDFKAWMSQIVEQLRKHQD